MAIIDNTSLFVSNFSWNLSQEDMEELFSVYGELESANLIIDKNTGRSKGFGFVKFIKEESANQALQELNNREIDGREIQVSIARPRE